MRPRAFRKPPEATFSSIVSRMTGLAYLLRYAPMEVPITEAEMYGLGQIVGNLADELASLEDLIQCNEAREKGVRE